MDNSVYPMNPSWLKFKQKQTKKKETKNNSTCKTTMV